MIMLLDSQTGAELGAITRAELDVLVAQLEEESREDQDYYINRATVDLLAAKGADAKLVGILRQALGDRADMDIRWEER
jgi:processive 1,2-diacylglycerol beta-glucosyltransferase